VLLLARSFSYPKMWHIPFRTSALSLVCFWELCTLEDSKGFFRIFREQTWSRSKHCLKNTTWMWLGHRSLLPPAQRSPLSMESPQAKVFRIGVLSPGCHPPTANLDLLLQGLRDLGYAEGENLAIECRYSEGRAERFPELAAELARLPVDLIVAVSTPAALAAKAATETVPIVMVYVADPVGTGLVTSLARPGGNLTGVSDMAIDLSAKRLELLKEAVPKLERVAVLWNAADPGMVARFREIEAAARVLKVGLQSVEVRNTLDFEPAFATIARERPDALFVVAEVLTLNHRCQVLDFAAQHRLPAIYEFGVFAREGGLMAYGPRLTETFQRSAYYVDQILKSAQAGRPARRAANEFRAGGQL